jgi:hypothetical protein
MTHIYGTGHEGKGKQNGGDLGQCHTISDNKANEKLGKSMGL